MGIRWRSAVQAAYFFATMRSFKLQINADRGEVIFHEETHPSRPKKAK